MFHTPHYITGPYIPHPVYLPDPAYSLALDTLVKGCSDILILSSNRSHVLLGKRKVEPQPDWWFLGGRMKPGESPAQAAQRNIQRELGLHVHVGRFHVLMNVSMVWSRREQEPKDHGTADISTLHTLTLTVEEEESWVPTLDPKEYSESRWWRIENVTGDPFHPCVVQAISVWKAKRNLEDLEHCVMERKEDKESIVQKAIALIQAWREVKEQGDHPMSMGRQVSFDKENGTYQVEPLPIVEKLKLYH